MNEAPRGLTRKQLLLGLAFAAVSLGALYIVLPNIAGLGDTWRRLDRGEPGWLTAALILEILSFLCYVALFRGVIGDEAGIGWAQSYRITLASLAATRLLAAGGIGGIALTAWALRRDGLSASLVALRMATLLVLLYTVYMGAVVLTGLGLRIGILSGPSPIAFTLVPAAVAGLIIVASLPPVGVIVASYFVGMTANLLPLPGGVGGVEGGMIGSLIAFNVPGGLAIVAVLSYRAFSFWLPTIPGAIAYVSILRRDPAPAPA